MDIVKKYVLDRVEIEQQWKSIGVRHRIVKFVTDGSTEIEVGFDGLHRISLDPGDWDGANKWSVRAYADIAWTPEVIAAWEAEKAKRRPTPAEPAAT